MSSNWLSVVMNTSLLPPLPPLQQEGHPIEEVEKESDECHLSTFSQLSNPQYLQHTPCNPSQTNSSTHSQGPSSSIAVSRAESPYKCEICGKGFSTVGNRKTHQKIVCEGILDYQCTFCNKKFGQKNNMETHVKAMHTHPGSQDYQCSFCSQRYSLHASVKRHMKKKHKEKLANELPYALCR
jgi:DNA-directed RNA polymerase subunit RPC12/RpoP